jgi:hypothetical protein
MKRTFVAVLGNDDDRAVYVHSDELHPGSRLRGVVSTAPRGAVVEWGCSRDTLRSLIASQRACHLLPVGSATGAELEVELARDCVDISPPCPPPSAARTRLSALCAELADALRDWPLLAYSMSSIDTGANVEWTCGASFFFVRLARKPFTRGLRAKPLRDLLGAVCTELVARGVTAEEMAPSTDAQGATAAMADGERALVLQSVRDALERPNRFAFARYDGPDGQVRAVRDAVRYILECADLAAASDPRGASLSWPAGAEWARDVASLVRTLHLGVPNVGSLFAAPGSVERQLLQDAMGECGLVVTTWDLEAAVVPIVFPSMWAGAVGATPSSAGGVVLRVDLLHL